MNLSDLNCPELNLCPASQSHIKHLIGCLKSQRTFCPRLQHDLRLSYFSFLFSVIMVLFGKIGRKIHALLVLCSWLLSCHILSVNQYRECHCLNTELILSSQSLCKKGEWKTRMGIKWESKCDVSAILCGCVIFFFLLQLWWPIVKLNEKQAKLYSKWLFICMLGGLTLCPVVNGDRKMFLFMFYFNN